MALSIRLAIHPYLPNVHRSLPDHSRSTSSIESSVVQTSCLERSRFSSSRVSVSPSRGQGLREVPAFTVVLHEWRPALHVSNEDSLSGSREDQLVKRLTTIRPGNRLVRPLVVLSLSASLGLSVASTSIAQDTADPATRVDLGGAIVAIHGGTCDDLVLEPAVEVGVLEFEARYANVIGLAEDFEEIGSGDIDADGVLDADEDAYLSEDVDDDGMLEEGEDLNVNGVLDTGFDENGDGVLEGVEIITGSTGQFTTVWKAENEVDATFDDLFDESEDEDGIDTPGVIAVRAGSGDSDNIVACAQLDAAAGWEERDTVVLGLTPEGDTDLYGYAVFERDTGNVPIFGENTTGVTVYVIDSPPTLRDSRTTESTPES